MASNPSSTTLMLFFFIVSSLFLIGTSYLSSNYAFLECLEVRLENSSLSSNIIYTPRNASYASLLQPPNLRPTSAYKPIPIITPFFEFEIQAAVYCSREIGLQIRVRSGGHDYEGLSYTSGEPFAVVDMRNFDMISVDTEAKTAWVESGATLGQLYYTISQKSRILAFTAGACPTVGVGGHFSGGGYGMMSRKHAIAADHIIDAKLIDSNGRILDRRSMGEDLFWAIRGGGGTSFGIIIAFKVKLLVVPEIVTVFNVTRTLEQNMTQLVHKWQYVADSIDERLLMRLFVNGAKSPSGKVTVSASFTSLFLDGVQNLLPIMQENFPELGLAKEDCIEMSWVESNLFFANLHNVSLNALLNRHYNALYFKCKSDYVREPISIDGLREIWRFLKEAEDEKISHQLQFSPYGGVLNTHAESDIPFPHRFGNIFLIHYRVSWSTGDIVEVERYIKWVRRIYNHMTQYVSKSPRATYFNYRDLDIGYNNNQENTSDGEASIWGVKYFKGNYKRLVHVKTKFDPSNFFRNEQSIPPLATKDEEGLHFVM